MNTNNHNPFSMDYVSQIKPFKARPFKRVSLVQHKGNIHATLLDAAAKTALVTKHAKLLRGANI